MDVGEKTIAREIKRMKDLGVIDGLIGAKNVGRIIDLHNQLLEKKKEKDFAGDIQDRNKYYWKLWKRATEETKMGYKAIKRLVPRKFYYPTESKIKSFPRGGNCQCQS